MNEVGTALHFNRRTGVSSPDGRVERVLLFFGDAGEGKGVASSPVPLMISEHLFWIYFLPVILFKVSCDSFR